MATRDPIDLLAYVEMLEDELTVARQNLAEAEASQGGAGTAEQAGTVEAAVEVPTIDPPEVDEGSHAVRWRGQTCPLGPTIAFELFKVLCSRAGCWVGVEDLLDAAWHPGAIRTDEAIRSAVFRLRRWLEVDAMQDLAAAIVAKAGHYRIVAIWKNETPDETAGATVDGKMNLDASGDDAHADDDTDDSR